MIFISLAPFGLGIWNLELGSFLGVVFKKSN
jgi:hypothetical protein